MDVEWVLKSLEFRTAALLGGATGLTAAVAAPLMLRMVPDGSPRLSLPVPLFAMILGLLLAVVYGLLAWVGLRLSRRWGLDPAPLLMALGTRAPLVRIGPLLATSLGAGLACGGVLVGAVWAIGRLAPGTLPSILHPPTPLAALAASAAAALSEEILTRLFLLSVVLQLLPRTQASLVAAVLVSAVLFGILHTPAWVVMFSGLGRVPALSWVWLIGLNGLVGLVCGTLFVRLGIEAAILGHLGCDLIWHVASTLRL